jgi:hypothetical protein
MEEVIYFVYLSLMADEKKFDAFFLLLTGFKLSKTSYHLGP